MPDNPPTHQTLEPVHMRANAPKTSPGAVGEATPVQSPPTDGASSPPPPAVQPTKPAPKPTQAVINKKPPKQSGNNVALAIVATIIIVLGLAGLAVFAYMKAQK